MLKCTMLHSYPKEYYELYHSFKEGGTIRLWVNAVERMGRRVLEKDPMINRIQLMELLPDDWTINLTVDGFDVGGPKNPSALSVMRTMGASWSVDQQRWLVGLEAVAEYLGKDVLYKFKGDMLEVLSEIFFNQYQTDEGFGVREYAPVCLSEDFGVDATGINVNGHKVAIQVKYRSNPDDKIPYSDIARTFTSAVCQLKLQDVIQHDHTVYLFTVANGVTAAFQTVMGKKAVVINREIISRKIDNNLNFWRAAFQEIEATMRSP